MSNQLPRPARRRAIKPTADYEVGYGRPPTHSRFKPGESGNKAGRPKVLKKRDIARDIQAIFTREVIVRDGGRTRRVPSFVALVQKSLVDAINGDKKATQFSYKVAEAFGVFKLKDEVRLDLSKLTDEERAICLKGAELLKKAGVLFRFEDR